MTEDDIAFRVMVTFLDCEVCKAPGIHAKLVVMSGPRIGEWKHVCKRCYEDIEARTSPAPEVTQ